MVFVFCFQIPQYFWNLGKLTETIFNFCNFRMTVCISRDLLQHEHLLEKIGFGTAENVQTFVNAFDTAGGTAMQRAAGEVRWKASLHQAR